AQRDRHADAVGHGDVGRVGVVVGLERDDLVARLDQREHGRRDRLGGAGGDQDLAVRVVTEAVEPLVVRCDGLAQLRYAGARRVLVAAAGQDRVGRDLGDLGRPVPVGETLAQVDGPGDQGARGHLGEDRGAEALQAPVQQWSAHEPNDITRSQVRLQGMRVALCQIPVSSRAEVNSGRVRDALERAADQGADLAVFPEATQVRFGSDLRAAAEPLDGPFCSGLAAAAKQTGVALVAGVFEPAPGGRVYNTAVAYDGAGELVTAYRKLHLFDAFGHRESDEVAPGFAPGWRSATTCGSASCPGRSRWPGPSCSCCPPPGRPGCSRKSTGSPWCGPAPSRTPCGWRPSARCPTRTNRRPRPRPASGAACWSIRSAWSGPTSDPRPA